MFLDKLVIGMFLVSTASAYAQDRNPTGERALYQVDTNRQRTSNMIRSGSFDTSVVGPTADASEPSYDVNLAYKFQLLLREVTGSERLSISSDYFQEQFMIDLRANGSYNSPKFKIQHLGYKDAHTIFNRNYPHCDYLRFYDIDTARPNPFLDWLFVLMAEAVGRPIDSQSIEDLEIFVHVTNGIPVLGGVKLDAKGKYDGVAIKVGADYKPQ